MRSIWKYAIHAGSNFLHVMPKDSTIVHVDTQHGEPQMWVDVTEPNGLLPGDEIPTEAREFFIVGTGQPFATSGATYRGTFFQELTRELHLYEVES